VEWWHFSLRFSQRDFQTDREVEELNVDRRPKGRINKMCGIQSKRVIRNMMLSRAGFGQAVAGEGITQGKEQGGTKRNKRKSSMYSPLPSHGHGSVVVHVRPEQQHVSPHCLEQS
jgi:hypothetical protein